MNNYQLDYMIESSESTLSTKPKTKIQTLLDSKNWSRSELCKNIAKVTGYWLDVGSAHKVCAGTSRAFPAWREAICNTLQIEISDYFAEDGEAIRVNNNCD